ncbi:MAG TPA: sensor histidine kinase [Candidatus Eisenbergiella merdavium]|uniref:histidine kinase n=1 Tax=Candidatus Eisenbergiella merdavium TaxID=2838551 RepID=A0A9D2NKS4_9FIRM|nr:sensor histidine kinase [Candidatus Eisenbergiella merdavium]
MNDQKELLLICAAGGGFFFVLLFLLGLNLSELALLGACFLGILFFALLWDFRKRRRRLKYLQETLEALDQKYLFADVATQPETELEQLYFRILKTALKSMTDEVAESRRAGREYREFIEQWVHEIKAPLTGIRLLCENNRSALTRRILAEAESVEQDVEKILFYARLGSVEKDYLIRPVSLRECVLEALAGNRQIFLQNGVRVHTSHVSHSVCSDKKWLCFILNQILLNCVKYRRKEGPVIELGSKEEKDCVLLMVTDNGIGIPAGEVERVFDKGFVGSNGRAGGSGKTGTRSTGLGLYLCASLCERLGIGIRICSEEGEYTTVTLLFPKEELLSYKTVT